MSEPLDLPPAPTPPAPARPKPHRVRGAVHGAVTGGWRGAAAGALVSAKKAATPDVSSAKGLLKAEFVACLLLLALSPLGGGEAKQAVKRMGSMCAVFLVLGLVSAGGPKASKVAAGVGGLITVALLLGSGPVFQALAGRAGAGWPSAGQAGDAVGSSAADAVAGANDAIRDAGGAGGTVTPDGTALRPGWTPDVPWVPDSVGGNRADRPSWIPDWIPWVPPSIGGGG